MGVRIYIPLTYELNDFEPRIFRDDFTVEIVDPCLQTEILPFTILDQ